MKTSLPLSLPRLTKTILRLLPLGFVLSTSALALPPANAPAEGTLCPDGVTKRIRGARLSSPNLFAKSEVMIDDRTNLMWKRCVEGFKGEQCFGQIKLFNWKEAQAYPKTVSFEGYSDWRLPTTKEVLEVMTYGCGGLDKSANAFPSNHSKHIVWSPEESSTNPEYAWISVLGSGSMYVEKSMKFPVRLVRNVTPKR
jgi:hypothetical protein